MSVTLTITGDEASQASAAGSDLLHAITGETPTEMPPSDDEPKRIVDPATGIALIGVVLAIPGAVLAGLDIAARLRKRKELAEKVEATKRVLESTDSEGSLTISEVTISITGEPTDQIVDKLLDQMKG
ncbi:MAG: hypothetical protein AAGI34_14290 [Pseudomonadota bacterium]